MPKPLQILAWESIGIGAIGILATLIVYLRYQPNAADAGVVMNVGVTGVMVGLYFFAFALFGWMILQGKTWGLSGLILTHIILLIITYTVIKSGAIWLAIIFGVLAIQSLALALNGQSMNWYRQQYQNR